MEQKMYENKRKELNCIKTPSELENETAKAEKKKL